MDKYGNSVCHAFFFRKSSLGWPPRAAAEYLVTLATFFGDEDIYTPSRVGSIIRPKGRLVGKAARSVSPTLYMLPSKTDQL